jgi:hypothetical protein
MLRQILVCLLLTSGLLPTWSDPPEETPLGACYMGYGKMLEAARAHQLSLNAHVERFLYQPGGLEIAYQGSERNGDEIVHFIRLVGVKQGTITTLISTTGDTEDEAEKNSPKEVPYELAGWSGDGRYLLLSREHDVATADGEAEGGARPDFVSVDVGVIPPHLTTLSLSAPERVDTGTVLYGSQHWWSPDRMRIAFAMQGAFRQGEATYVRREEYHGVYDLKTDSLQTLTLTDKQFLRGWLDGQHLLVDDNPAFFENLTDTKINYSAYEISTGAVAALPTPKKPLPYPDSLGQSPPSDISPKASYLKMEDEFYPIPDKQKVEIVDTHVLWVRRTQGPKVMSAVPVGVTPGTADPQTVWSPTGTQVAFIAHGDLFVTDLTIRDATAIEKYKAGEELTCQEEREVAISHLKQIGLGLIQYSQDYDENLPSSDHWQDKIKPYLGTDTLYSVGKYQVAYRPPTDLAFAHIDYPAGTVIATLDLPCASLALMADGHVKVFADKATEKRYEDEEKQFEDSQKKLTGSQ